MNKTCRPRCGKFVLLAIAGVAALGLVVMGLWNWLIPAIFTGAHEISYWQAMGILLLSKILFGGFRGPHGFRGGPGHWQRERWARMTPEEREKLQAGLSRHCGKPADTTAEAGH